MIVPYNALLYLALIRPLFCIGAIVKPNWNKERKKKKKKKKLTADKKYSGSNMQNFPQQFQTPLPHKQKTFSLFFIAFLKGAWNLEHFQKKRWIS